MNSSRKGQAFRGQQLLEIDEAAVGSGCVAKFDLQLYIQISIAIRQFSNSYAMFCADSIKNRVECNRMAGLIVVKGVI